MMPTSRLSMPVTVRFCGPSAVTVAPFWRSRPSSAAASGDWACTWWPSLRSMNSATVPSGDQPAVADDDDVVRGQGHLAHQVAGDQDGPAFEGQGLQELADPEDAFGIEPVDRLVEDQDGGVAEERGGDAESLAHSQGEATGPLGPAGQADGVKDLIDAAGRDLVGRSQPGQVVARGAARCARHWASSSAPTSRSGAVPA